MKNKYLSIAIVFLLTSNNSIIAQKETFNVGAILGVNFSSLSHDDYDFIGLNTGIFCNADINKHYDIKAEFLFSQNGEYILPTYYPNINFGKIRLNYIEIPFHFDYYINSHKRTEFLPDWALEIGFAYTRLFSYYAEDLNGYDITDQVIFGYKDTFLLQFGTTVYFTKHFAYSIRFSKPLKNSMLELTGTFRLIYRL